MTISKAKILYYFVTFQKSKIPEYLLEVANNWVVNGLADTTKASIQEGLETGRTILAALTRYAWLCPERWRQAYTMTINAFADVVTVCSDLQVTVDEITTVADSFKVAFAEWSAD